MGEAINYTPNSHKYKEEQKKLPDKKRPTKIVTGKVKTKKNEIRKFTDIFIAEDIRSVKDYVVHDILVPTVKKAFYDIIVGGLDMSLFGGRGNGGRRTVYDKVSYTDFSSRSRRNDERRHNDSRFKSVLDYDDIVLDSRGDAEAVLSSLGDIMETYDGICSVADLYDLVGETPPLTANNYGWTNLRNAEIVRQRDGKYWLKMPKALPLR